MALTYTNRKDVTYYFKVIYSKNGKPRYYPTIKKEGELLSDIPNGYEIYEHPEEGQVVLRKKVKKLFNKEEIKIIEKAINETANIKHFIIDVKEKYLTIYIDNSGGENINESIFGKKIYKFLIQHQYYSPKMRFIKNNGKYTIQRMCYLGSVDDWMYLNESNDLKKLAKTYCQHLDKESFYELI